MGGVTVKHTHVGQWLVCGSRYPRQEIVFFAQILLIYAVVLSSVVNLALNRPKPEFWTGALSGCLGYLLPSPSLAFKKPVQEDDVDGRKRADHVDGPSGTGPLSRDSAQQ